MDELVKLLRDAPPEFKEKARAALLEIVNEYEDWKSLGCPDATRYHLMKFARDPDCQHSELQGFVKRLLNKEW